MERRASHSVPAPVKTVVAAVLALLLGVCQNDLKPVLRADTAIAAGLVARVGSGALLENITYCNGGGRAPQMDLQYPRRIKDRMPVVFYFHGGAWV